MLKRFLRFALTAATLMLSAAPTPAQAPTKVAVQFGGTYAYPAAVTTADITRSFLGNTVIVVGGGESSASGHTVTWSNDGTAATACTYRFIGSDDQAHWHNLSDTLSCTATGSQVLPAGSVGDSFSLPYRPWPYVAVQILSYTAANGTTAVKFRYTRGSN